MTETARRLRRLGLPHARARAFAVVLGGLGAALAWAALGLALAPAVPGVTVAWVLIALSAAAAVWLGRRARREAADAPVARLVPEWKSDPRKAKITIRHLGSHTSGVEDAEADKLPHDKLTGWKGDFWKRLAPPDDPFTLARDKAPVIFEPGEKLAYSNPGIAMLTASSKSVANSARRETNWIDTTALGHRPSAHP